MCQVETNRNKNKKERTKHMAVMKPTPADKREVNLNPRIRLPRNRYTVRIKEETFKMSNAKGDGEGNNPMIVLTAELVAPDTFIANDGSTVNIAGVELQKQYITLRVNGPGGVVDAKKSQEAFDRYADLRTLLGVPIGDEGVDVDNPPKVFVGKVVDAICEGEESVQRTDPTPEQMKKGELGSPIKDASGKELKSYRPKITAILGLADASVASGANPFK